VKTRSHIAFLVAIAGLGGLLYGYDIGIIGTALLYLDKCVRLGEQEVGMLASAVMVGALASSIVGGGFSDWLGRKKAMMISALLFAASVVMIVTAQGFWPLFFGRTLQGLSAGMIAVVIPVFMSECVPAKIRGLGSTVFQLSITLGILLAMAAGAYYQAGVKDAVAAAAGDPARILAVEDAAWRNMFRSSIWPAIAFFLVALVVSESPRWLFRRGRKEMALAVLLKGRDRAQADLEMREMEAVTGAARERRQAGGDPWFQRHYIVPLILAVVLLGLNQATGIVAVFTFPVVMLHQSGLSESAASHTGVWLALTNFTVTIFGVLLVDRLGRKRLLKIGTGVILLALTAGMLTFLKVEAGRQDVSARLQSAVAGNTLTMPVKDIVPSSSGPVQVNVIYAYNGREQMTLVRSDAAEPVLSLKPDAKSPAAELKIVRAKFSAAPNAQTGRIIFGCLLLYIVGFAFGPGVCLWLMSAELLPTRVRSLGMGLGVLFNALVSIGTTAVFLPVVGNFGYAAMWAVWLACTLAYFLFAAFVLPETKGKTLEEIEAGFVGKKTP
jgi:MFS transporter, SP family, solute carrier family 2 (myo-inositol transporter), member 13